MDTFTAVWPWIGNEIAAFGARWIVVGVAVFGFGGWFGWRYREMKRDISDLKRHAQSRQPAASSIHFAPVFNIGQREPNGPCVYDPHERTVWFGTEHGDMPVRFHDAETVMDDITGWLRETGQQGRVSPERIRRIMHRVQSGSS